MFARRIAPAPTRLVRFYSLTASHCPRRTWSGVSTAAIQTPYPGVSVRARARANHIQHSTAKRLITGQTVSMESKNTPSRLNEPTIHSIFEKETSTWQYIVADPASSHAVIIDPVLDYDRASQTISTESADHLLNMVKQHGYTIDMILETHVHADHLTAASYLQTQLSRVQDIQPVIGIGKRIEMVQRLFGERYSIPEAQYKGIFGKYFDDNEVFRIGELAASVLHLPGHTPDHLGYKIGDNVFCGDSVFHADIGTARCDFPGGSAHDLYHSGRKLLSLSDDVKIWTGHDYPPQGREGPRPWMSVREHRDSNKHLKDGTTLDAYVKVREERDAQMGEPRLLHPALQVNIRAGKMPEETAGMRFLRLPVRWPV